MKKKIRFGLLALAAAALFSVSNLRAQDTYYVEQDVEVEDDEVKNGEIGVHFLPMFTSLQFEDRGGNVVEGKASVGYGFGLMLGLNFSNHVGIQGEINYESISQKYKDQDIEREVDLQYLNFPLMLSLNTDKSKPVNFNMVLGPQFGLNIGAKMKGEQTGETDTVTAVIAVKEGDVGLAYGAGFDFAVNEMKTIKLSLGYRGAYGLVDIRGEDQGDNTYNVIVAASRKAHGAYFGLRFLF